MQSLALCLLRVASGNIAGKVPTSIRADLLDSPICINRIVAFCALRSFAACCTVRVLWPWVDGRQLSMWANLPRPVIPLI